MTNPLIPSSEIFRLWCVQVDEIAARIRAIWISARYLQNSFVPVNRLPPEVLGLTPLPLLETRSDQRHRGLSTPAQHPVVGSRYVACR